MDNNNQIITPTSYVENQAPQKKDKKKPIIFGLIVLAVLVVITIVIIAVVSSNLAIREQVVSGKRGELQYEGHTQSTTALNIYANIYENITLSDFEKVIKKSGYTFKTDTDDRDKEIRYLIVPTDSKMSGECLYSDGYIKYRIDTAEGLTEEQEPNKWAIDIEYHECVNGKDTYIMQIEDAWFRNFTGSATIDYDTKEDAILNQLSVRQK